MSVPYAKVIVNPAAGGCAAQWEWPRISRRLRDIGLSFDYEYSQGSGHAIELAQASVKAGYRYLIAVGGDGTVNEVANGILRSPISSKVMLGIISAGTACNFAHSLGIPQDYASACSLLTSQRSVVIDVGLVEYRSGGKTLERFFVNQADVGFGAAVVEARKRLPNRLGKTMNYALYAMGGLRSALSYRNQGAALCLENKVENIRLGTMVVANGAYFADGMHLAPQARVDDGLLDVVIAGDIGSLALLKILPKLYRESQTTHPQIRVHQATSVTIQSPEPLLVEADGELLGECPASFRVVPSALTIIKGTN